jgi:hypothetical protein
VIVLIRMPAAIGGALQWPAWCLTPTPARARIEGENKTLGGETMSYALTAGGPDHYPVQVGTMLVTLVEPHKGYERAFNRWPGRGSSPRAS